MQSRTAPPPSSVSAKKPRADCICFAAQSSLCFPSSTSPLISHLSNIRHSSYCLKHGSECQYSDGDASPKSTGTPPPRPVDSGAEAGEPHLALGDLTPNDQFIGTSLKLPDRSRSLFNLFTNTKVLYTTRVGRTSDSFMWVIFGTPSTQVGRLMLQYSVHRALTHPGFLHASLLLTALHWAWETGE